MPAVQIFDHGLGFVELGNEGEAVGFFAADPVFRADGDPVQITEHVQFGEGNVRRPLHFDAVTRRDEIDGPDSPRPSGLCAVFRAGFPKPVRLLTEEFRDERSFSDAGGIRLHDADHAVDLCRRQPRADRRIGGKRIGRGRIGINAVVQVAERAELRFKQDVFPCGLHGRKEGAGIGDEGKHGEAICIEPAFQCFVSPLLGAVHAFQNQVFPFQQFIEMRFCFFRIEEFARKHGLFLIFVRVERGNALLRRSVFPVLEPRLFECVEVAVPGEKERSAAADF